MKKTKRPRFQGLALRLRFVTFAAWCVVGVVNDVLAATYGVQLISATGGGSLMNDAGDIVGVIQTPGPCFPYPSCQVKNTVVVWPAGKQRAVPLPSPADRPFIAVSGMNAAGWLAGTASSGLVGFAPQPVAWEPSESGYTLHNIGLLPGNTIARVAGIDDLNRVVGYSTDSAIGPPNAAPFVWDPIGGLRNLTDSGFPNEIPLALSPHGTVALLSSWYRLDTPGVITPNAPTPKGFIPEASAEINDAGDQARFLITGGSQNIAYFYRYVSATGEWQQLSGMGSGRLSRYGVGSINDVMDITGTIASSGVIAAGPEGLSTSLAAQLSPAYGGMPITSANSLNKKGHILAAAGLGGHSLRLVRLFPTKPCTASCLRVATLQMVAKRVTQCRASNQVSVTLTVTDEAGKRQPGVQLRGRFLDGYWLDQRVSGTTDTRGVVRFTHTGRACVGAITFFVDQASAKGRVFDRNQGVLVKSIIPSS